MLRHILGASLCLCFNLIALTETIPLPTQPFEPSYPSPEPVLLCEDQVIRFMPYSSMFHFKNVGEVTLSVYCVDNAYGRMVLDYEADGILTSKELTISSVALSNCGHHLYFGHYQSSAEGGYRFSVRLTDLASNTCHDIPFRWTAEVRSGYGFCGTGDSVMTLIEKPYEYHW